MKKTLLISTSVFLCLFILKSSELSAQDIHFSQFNQTPSLINPALTGATSVLRASVIYKDQWRSVTVPYKTYGASIEMKFKASNWDKTDKYSTKKYKKAFSRLAGGLSFYSDKAGDGNMGSNQVNLSLASFVPLNKENSIAIGLQGSFVQRQLDFTRLSFPSQYNGLGGYNTMLNSGEDYASQNFIYPDIAAGFLWKYESNEKTVGANDDFKANAGVAVFHINQPKLNYLIGTKEQLAAKFIIHGDFLIGIKNTNIAFAPSYMIAIQGPSTEILAGTMIKYYFKSDTKYTGFIKRSAFSLGGFYRNKDAMVLSTMFEFEQYAIGFSYDLNTSKLTTASSGKGGAEIFVRFVTSTAFLYQKAGGKK